MRDPGRLKRRRPPARSEVVDVDPLIGRVREPTAPYGIN
jgi:hypothetical protein